MTETIKQRKKRRTKYKNRFAIMNGLTDLIPYFEAGLTSDEMAILFRRTRVTIFRWKRRLRELGYQVDFKHEYRKGGRPRLRE